MRDKFSNVLWGLFFVLIGVGFAGNVLFDWDFTLLFPGWWTLFIIIPCFISMIKNGCGVGSTVGFIIGVLLLASYYVNLNFSVWQLVIPAILIFIGIRIMFQNTFHKRPQFNDQNFSSNMNSSNTGNNDGTGSTQGSFYTDSSRREVNAIFSHNNVRVTETFSGASLNAVFGSIVLDLRDAKLPGDVEISAQSIFGGIDIYAPAGVKVKISNVPIFGGVSNKTGGFIDPAAPTIYLNSTCMFGGIDIK